AYMSPEQAHGRQADKRADIWSFGVVLYEMLTGRQAFSGESISDTLASVLKLDPDWDALPSDTPAPIRKLLRRCLDRDRKRRLQAIGEARIAIEEYAADPAASVMMSAPAAVAEAKPPWRRALPWGVAGLMAALFVLSMVLRPEMPEPPLRKFNILVEDLWMEETRTPKLSADGSRLLYVKTGLIWVRELNDLVPRQLPGTEEAWLSVWSPRGDEVAFVRAGSLWKTSLSGGQPGPIAALPTYICNAGMAWGEDNRIYYSPGCSGRGLFSVSAQGGDFEEILPVEENESDYHEIRVLPDGRGLVLVLDTGGGSTDTLVVFDGRERKTILQAEDAEFANPMYSPTGHLLYERRGDTPGLWAAPFSLSRLEITGEPFLIAPGAARSSLSADGTLAFLSSVALVKAQTTWVNRDGEAVEQMGEGMGRARYMRLSPDGNLAAVSAIPEKGDDNEEIYLVDLARGTQTRLTFSDTSISRLSWNPAGDTLYYESGRTIFTKAANGTGDAKEIVNPGRHPDVSRDGKFLVFIRPGETSDPDLWYLPLEEGADPVPFVEDPGSQRYPAISPDGRFVAYESNENGRLQIFVKSFPGGEGKWQVSIGEGHKARWNRRGDRLYYAADANTMMEVEVETRPAFRLGQPRELFRYQGFYGSLLWRGFDVDRNGDRFLVAGTTTASERTATITIVQNWFAEFKDRN
ncbi:MAG: protein kinase, partial [Candidatus Acidiferrales bacterium]